MNTNQDPEIEQIINLIIFDKLSTISEFQNSLLKYWNLTEKSKKTLKKYTKKK